MVREGYKNEYKFVKYLDEKKVREINPLFRECFEEVFDSINEGDVIYAWKNQLLQKPDIFVKINEEVKGISLKMGSNNSVHATGISEFIHFLIQNGVKKEIINEYLKYHYADGTTNGSGKIRQSVSEYKEKNQEKIDIINHNLNNKKLIEKAIEKFIIRGNDYNRPIDLLIYGEVNDFLWISKEDIIKILIGKRNLYSTGVHFSKLSCQPMARCLNRNPMYEQKRYCVQIKWFSLFDDIIQNMNDKIIRGIKEEI